MLSEKIRMALRSHGITEAQLLQIPNEGRAWRLLYEFEGRSKIPKKDVLPEICFTGFLPAEKEAAIGLATSMGFAVRSGVTKNLRLLVAGDSPGPAKMALAADQGVQIISEADFRGLVQQFHAAKANPNALVPEERCTATRVPSQENEDETAEAVGGSGWEPEPRDGKDGFESAFGLSGFSGAQAKAIFTVGLTLHAVQRVERLLGHFLACIAPDDGKITVEAILNSTDQNRKETVGGLLRKLAIRATVEPTFEADLRQFTEDRNRFVHRLFAEEEFALGSDEGATRATAFMDGLAQTASGLQGVLHTHIVEWASLNSLPGNAEFTEDAIRRSEGLMRRTTGFECLIRPTKAAG